MRAAGSEAPWAVVRALARRASAGCVRAAISAGARPKRTPVTSESAKAKPMTSGEGEAVTGMLCWFRKGERQQRVRSEIGDGKAEQAADTREKHAFRQKLAHNAAALRAEC